jgi:peroxiredoxin
MNRKALWALLAAAAAVLAAWSLLGTGGIPSEGKPAPPLRVLDLAGKPVELASFRGRVVLVDFWATWCEACVEELPVLRGVYSKIRGADFELLGISMGEETAPELEAFAKAKGLRYPILLGNSAAARDFAVVGLPAMFLIDREGVVVKNYLGMVEKEELEADIQKALSRRDS